MKYIDADSIKDEIKHLKIDVYDESHQFDLGARCSLTFLESFIDSLQQEQPDVFDTAAFQKGVQEGRRLEREDVKSTIQSRIDEILGDAQPAPILRMELQELIKKIEA